MLGGGKKNKKHCLEASECPIGRQPECLGMPKIVFVKRKECIYFYSAAGDTAGLAHTALAERLRLANLCLLLFRLHAVINSPDESSWNHIRF